MPPKRSAIEQRREQIAAQIAHLRERLTVKTRQDYTSDFRYLQWLKQSHALINELLDELSIINDPGEYNELPMVVVADELGLSLKQVRQLINLGEIDATGKHAHEYISRNELERLAKLGPSEILRLSKQELDVIFSQAVDDLRSSDIVSAERSYRRLKARQTSIGTHALAVEIALNLVRGKFEEARRVVQFILQEIPHEREMLGDHIARFLRGVCFKSQKVRAAILDLLKQLSDITKSTIQADSNVDDLQSSSIYIASVFAQALALLKPNIIPANRSNEFHQFLKDSVFTALYAEATSHASVKSKAFLMTTEQRIPYYWEPAKLLEDLHEK